MSDTTGFDQDTPPEPMPVEATAQPVDTTIHMPSEVIPAAPIAEDEEVDINDALTEAQDGDVDFSADPVPEESQEDILDKIVPRTEPVERKFGTPDMPLVFVQRRLSFVAKMQWFALVGTVMDKAMSGPDGVSVSQLFEAPTGGIGDVNNLREADTFVRAVGKLAIYAPMFLVDSYCIWLGVPEHQRPLVREVMALPEEDGGLSDDMGLDILEVFIDQNYDALADFFTGKLGALRDRVAARNAERNAARSAG